ncbi:hypothetical protein SO802_017672 [Lithocarpus litseifolius]|uniref:Uncharacterized protein n=1 Tax=Lithocarpus litseifolius TaxID=425828 RepID=A0AAW2CLM1_9ROSI
MLAPHSMTNVEYNLWGPGIPFTRRVTVDLDYDEFSGTHLMPSLITEVGPTVGALIDHPHLPWLVYAYDPDGFAREHPVRHNTNVTGNLFLDGTWAEHEELIWLARNLKLELTEYSRQLYGGKGVGGDDDDDDGGDNGGDDAESSKSTPSYKSRKWCFR